MSKTDEKVDQLIAAAIEDDQPRLSAARAFCNSASAFLLLVKKHAADGAILRESLRLGKLWKKNRLAKTILATIKAIKAAAALLLEKQEREALRERARAAAADIVAAAAAAAATTTAAFFTHAAQQRKPHSSQLHFDFAY